MLIVVHVTTSRVPDFLDADRLARRLGDSLQRHADRRAVALRDPAHGPRTARSRAVTTARGGQMVGNLPTIIGFERIPADEARHVYKPRISSTMRRLASPGGEATSGLEPEYTALQAVA